MDNKKIEKNAFDGIKGSIADRYIEETDKVKASIMKLKEKKEVADKKIQALKNVNESLKNNLINYMLERNLRKVEGLRKCASISVYAEKDKREAVLVQELEVAGKYIDVKTLNREFLLELIFNSGFFNVKESYEEKVVKQGSRLRVIR